VFRLMFGQGPSLKKAKHVQGAAHACFSKLIDQVGSIASATSAWRHATDCIAIVDLRRGLALDDQDYNATAPNIGVNQLIAGATPASSPHRLSIPRIESPREAGRAGCKDQLTHCSDPVCYRGLSRRHATCWWPRAVTLTRCDRFDFYKFTT
jgi:hypothetical protein